MWNTFPLFGGALLLGVMVVASYTFAVALPRGRRGDPAPSRPRASARTAPSPSSRVAVLVPRLRVRQPRLPHPLRRPLLRPRRCRRCYLITALWGGQDGSLLWWLFLLSVYIGACVVWLGKRYLELQPYIIATLMAIVLFFCVLMAFAANPFATSVARRARDGEGLNPLLQNFYMIIHPPSLYTGFVGCSRPVRVRGRRARHRAASTTSGSSRAASGCSSRGCSSRSATRSACSGPTRSSAGAATGPGIRSRTPRSCRGSRRRAYVHSMMIQERRGMLKVWNVFLICLTFFLTIFGTFLTRSGAHRERPLVRAVEHRHLLRLLPRARRRRSASRSSSTAGRSSATSSPRTRRDPHAPHRRGRHGLDRCSSSCLPRELARSRSSPSPSAVQVVVDSVVVRRRRLRRHRDRLPAHDAGRRPTTRSAPRSSRSSRASSRSSSTTGRSSASCSSSSSRRRSR